MRRHRVLFYVRILMSVLVPGLPLTAWADGALLIKGGVVRLDDTSQYIDGQVIHIDEDSPTTFAINLEHRVRSGMAFGVEYLTQRREFTPPTLPSPGKVETQILQFLAKKYFIDHGMVHPYLGIGAGFGYTSYEYWTGPVRQSDGDGSLALQGLAGIELRIDNLSAVAEIKHYWHDKGSNAYNPGSTGLFFGLGFNW